MKISLPHHLDMTLNALGKGKIRLLRHYSSWQPSKEEDTTTVLISLRHVLERHCISVSEHTER